MPSERTVVQPEIQNFFVLVLIGLVCMWVFRIARSALSLLELRHALKTNQIVGLSNDSLAQGAPGGVLGGGAPGTNMMRTHLMQAARNARARMPVVDMLRLYSAVCVHRDSLQCTLEPSGSGVALSFEFDCCVPCSVELYWGVDWSAVDALRKRLARVGHERMLKMLETEAAAARAAGNDKDATSRGKRTADAISPLGSAVRAELSPTGARILPSSDVAVSIPGAFFPRDHFDRAFGPVNFPAGARHRFALPPDAAMRPADLASLASPAPSGDGGPARAPLALVIRPLQPLPLPVLHAQHAAACSGHEDHLPQVHESRSDVLFVTFDAPPGPPAPHAHPLAVAPAAQLMRHVACADFGAFEVQEVYGFLPDAGTEDDEHTCLVCLTDPPSVTLLPCRHHCVCVACFAHLDSCPVCRANILSYTTTVGAAAAAASSAQSVPPPGDAADAVAASDGGVSVVPLVVSAAASRMPGAASGALSPLAMR